MKIARFSTTFDAAAIAVGNAGNVLRSIRDTTGPLPRRTLFGGLQAALATAKAATVDALTVVQIDPARANTILTDFPGGPQTVGALQAGALDIEAKAAAFNAAYAAWFVTLKASDIYEIAIAGDTGKEYSSVREKADLPPELVAPLRDSPELDALITAFEAVGG